MPLVRLGTTREATVAGIISPLVSRERQSPDWRLAYRQSGDWRCRDSTDAVRAKSVLLPFVSPVREYSYP